MEGRTNSAETLKATPSPLKAIDSNKNAKEVDVMLFPGIGHFQKCLFANLDPFLFFNERSNSNIQFNQTKPNAVCPFEE